MRLTTSSSAIPHELELLQDTTFFFTGSITPQILTVLFGVGAQLIEYYPVQISKRFLDMQRLIALQRFFRSETQSLTWPMFKSRWLKSCKRWACLRVMVLDFVAHASCPDLIANQRLW